MESDYNDSHAVNNGDDDSIDWDFYADDHPYHMPPTNEAGYAMTEEEARADYEEDNDDDS